MTTHQHTEPIPAPWILVDDLTIDQTADLLERLTGWLTTTDTTTASRCARSLSLGETDDPISITSWAEALTTRLRLLAQNSQLDPRTTQ